MPIYIPNNLKYDSEEELDKLTLNLITQMFEYPHAPRPFCDLAKILLDEFEQNHDIEDFRPNNFSKKKFETIIDSKNNFYDIFLQKTANKNTDHYQIEISKSEEDRKRTSRMEIKSLKTSNTNRKILYRTIFEEKPEYKQIININKRVSLNKIHSIPYWRTHKLLLEH